MTKVGSLRRESRGWNHLEKELILWVAQVSLALVLQSYHVNHLAVNICYSNVEEVSRTIIISSFRPEKAWWPNLFKFFVLRDAFQSIDNCQNSIVAGNALNPFPVEEIILLRLDFIAYLGEIIWEEAFLGSVIILRILVSFDCDNSIGERLNPYVSVGEGRWLDLVQWFLRHFQMARFIPLLIEMLWKIVKFFNFL